MTHPVGAARRSEAFTTVVDVLRDRAAREPDRCAYVVLRGGGSGEQLVTYGELDRAARAVATRMRQRVEPGARALLLHAPGIDYVVALFACMYAGVIAVPVYPPRSGAASVLRAVVQDAGPVTALTTSDLSPRLRRWWREERLPTVLWLATDTVAARRASELVDDGPAPDALGPAPDALALLQYTSGSTRTPRGVMLTHANLAANEQAILEAVGHGPGSILVSWLPPYHDMGLVGTVLQPLYGGFRAVLMSPADFLHQPVRWLRAITRYRATTSGGPNSAYEMCVARIPERQRAGLDLQSWRVAFNGSEPVRHQTLERFAEAFSPHGFRYDAFYPCYGLAEATSFVTGGDPAEPPVALATPVSSEPQADPSPSAPGPDELPRTLVGCGRSPVAQRLMIVDPERRIRCQPYDVGEIWVAGPSVASGYWGHPGRTRAAFDAHLAGTGEGPFLRTGDLGFLDSGGELFVTGRLDDLIVIDGRNHYPQDIEGASEDSHPALRRGRSAAFSIDVRGRQRLIIVAEVEERAPRGEERAPRGEERAPRGEERAPRGEERAPRRLDAPHADGSGDRMARIAEAVRSTVADMFGLQVCALALIRSGTIPKTASGKVRRRACRARFLTGRLQLAHPAGMVPAVGFSTAVGRPDLVQAAAPASEAGHRLLARYLRDCVAQACADDPVASGDSATLAGFGLDSLGAVQARGRIHADLGILVPVDLLLSNPTIDTLARRIVEQIAAGRHGDDRPRGGDRAPLQRRPAGHPRMLSSWDALERLSDTEVDALLACLLSGEDSDVR